LAGIFHDSRVSEPQLPIGQRYCLSGAAAGEYMDRLKVAAIKYGSSAGLNNSVSFLHKVCLSYGSPRPTREGHTRGGYCQTSRMTSLAGC
jgi:hypothetical protein